jgi:hypothetical protein
VVRWLAGREGRVVEEVTRSTPRRGRMDGQHSMRLITPLFHPLAQPLLHYHADSKLLSVLNHASHPAAWFPVHLLLFYIISLSLPTAVPPTCSPRTLFRIVPRFYAPSTPPLEKSNSK